CVAVDGSGNVFVMGSSVGSGSGRDYATLAYSGAGVALWTNRYNGPDNADDLPQSSRCLALGPDGAVYVTGASVVGPFTGFSDYATIKYSVAGLRPIPLNFQIVGSQIVLSWANAAFSLQSSPAAQGPYNNIAGAT